jgi:hypothetical protein
MSPLRTFNICLLGIATAGVIWLARHHQWLYATLLALGAFIGWPLVFAWFFGEHMTVQRDGTESKRNSPNRKKKYDRDA